MTNYRNTLGYNEIEDITIPMLADGSTIVYDKTKASGSAAYGLACTISGNGTVALVGDGEPVFGRVGLVEPDGKVVVHKGIVELPAGAGATVTAGKPIVGDLGAASAKGYIQNAVTTDASTVFAGRGEILNAATATAVLVRLP